VASRFISHVTVENLIVFSSCQDAVSLVKMEEDPEAAARKLTETAFGRGSGDNITCVVVKFQHDRTGSDSPSPSGDKS
jgi:protein phosphatase 1L